MGKQFKQVQKPYDPEDSVFEKPPLAPEATRPNIRTIPAQIILMANDGFSNTVAGLGEASLKMSSSSFVRSGLTERREDLNVIYRECAIAKRIIDMPSEEMTRSWYTLSSAKIDETDLNLLRALEAKHSVKQEITNGIRWGRLFGGAIAIMVINGDEERMDQPLQLKDVKPGTFKGLYVMDLTQGITPSIELEDDLDDPDYGLPKYYDVEMEARRGNSEFRSQNSELSGAGGHGPVYQQVRIHHSRVLRFIGRELPHSEMVRNSYWGASELEHPWDEIRRYLSTCENIGQLVFMANIITLKMGNFGSDLAYGSDRVMENLEQTVKQENRLRTSYGVQIMSADDSMENHPYNFGGIAEVKESFMLDVAGAAEIPATILFGRSPQGMNATGEADIRIYYDKIGQQQERVLRPVLEKLLPVMAMSCWGFVPDDMLISFNPVMTISPVEKAELSMKATQEVLEVYKSGLITKEQALRELIARGGKTGNWGNL
jgi:hypothetical protein